MRLPLNPGQWGAYILQAVIQQLPIIEPYVQYTQTLGSDSEGNGYGIIPVNNSFIPFVVRAFELKPFDLLIRDQNGEHKFCALSEANLLTAFNNVTMGEAVERLPQAIDRDVFLDMIPPYAAGGSFGAARRGAPGVQRSHSQVKLSSLILDLPDAHVARIFDAMKTASSTVAPFALRCILDASRTNTPLAPAHSTVKAAQDVNKLVTLELRPSGEVQVGMNNHFENVTLKTASTLVQAVNGDDLPRLFAGELLIYDYRPGFRSKQATELGIGYGDGQPIKAHTIYEDQRQRRDFMAHSRYGTLSQPGWYEMPRSSRTQPRKCRVFNTRQLTGRPSTRQLFVFDDGFALHTTTSGVRHIPVNAPLSDQLSLFYRKAHFKPGELCFLVYHDNGEASVPFRVNSVNLTNTDVTTLQVTPLQPVPDMDEIITLSFGSNRHPYTLSRHEIALPREGCTVFSLRNRDVSTEMADECACDTTIPTVQVKVYRGGGLFRVQEQQRHPTEPMTRGQFVQMLMARYGMDTDTAMKTLDDISSYKYDTFAAPVFEEAPAEAVEHQIATEPLKLAMDMYGLLKAAEGAMDNSADATAASQPDANAQTMDQSGRGAPGMLDTSAGVAPQVPGVQDVADVLMGYATSVASDEELTDMNQSLITGLADAIDTVGRLLLLARLGKLKFLTELELQRMLRECDKFRANLINVAVARGEFLSAGA